MATITRSPTPHTEPFPAAPNTPTSLPASHSRVLPYSSKENPNLLRPHSSGKSDLNTHITGRRSLSPKSPLGLSPRVSPAPLTGAAALADARRYKQQKEQEQASRQTSPNPAASALNELMSGGHGMSRPSDAPQYNKLSEPMRRVAEKITVPVSAPETQGISPTSTPSLLTLESTGAPSAMTVTANGGSNTIPIVAEPANMTESPAPAGPEGSFRANEIENKSSTYPGSAAVEQQLDQGPARNMSLPGVGEFQGSGTPRSPSTKRHKCPYCSTDFTRHHNLKSHLLTHSQEKPYVCQTCQARFRRLHDLKRHTKLHTGERPHTCPKCGRRFARGDALARHNKGPGGCAGRRSSFGDDGEGGEGGGDDDDMEGMEYGNHGDGRDDQDMLEQPRRVSEPSRKRTHLEAPSDSGRSIYRQHSSTYPPIAGRMFRGATGEMGPPSTVLGSSSGAASPTSSHNLMSPSATSSYNSSMQYPPPPNQPSVFAQGGMTESPKPLSPGQPDSTQSQVRLGIEQTTASFHRNRSPSLTQQFQQQHFGRGTGRGTTPHLGTHLASHPPQLPSLSGLASGHNTAGRPAMPTSAPIAGPSMLGQHQQIMSQQGGSQAGSMSSHSHHGSANSIRDVLGGGGGGDPADLWGYVRNLENRFSRMQDEYELRISRLQEDVIGLKGQLGYPPR